mgnify:CR=1 FL=1
MKITQRQLRRIIREELSKSLTEFDLSPFPGQKDKADSIISAGTKVRDKNFTLYTVQSVDSEGVTLLPPDGAGELRVSMSDFEKEYDLD